MPPNTTVAIETALMAEMYDVKARLSIAFNCFEANFAGKEPGKTCESYLRTGMPAREVYAAREKWLLSLV